MDVVVVGGGVAGLGAALALARRGHSVTVVERDDTPMPPSADEAFDWDRRGAPQVRHSHAFLARLVTLAARTTPTSRRSCIADGATEMRFGDDLPPTMTDFQREPERRRPVDAGLPAHHVRVGSAPCCAGRRARRVPHRRRRRRPRRRPALPGATPHVRGVRLADGTRGRCDLVVGAPPAGAAPCPSGWAPSVAHRSTTRSTTPASSTSVASTDCATAPSIRLAPVRSAATSATSSTACSSATTARSRSRWRHRPRTTSCARSSPTRRCSTRAPASLVATAPWLDGRAEPITPSGPRDGRPAQPWRDYVVDGEPVATGFIADRRRRAVHQPAVRTWLQHRVLGSAPAGRGARRAPGRTSAMRWPTTPHCARRSSRGTAPVSSRTPRRVESPPRCSPARIPMAIPTTSAASCAACSATVSCRRCDATRWCCARSSALSTCSAAPDSMTKDPDVGARVSRRLAGPREPPARASARPETRADLLGLDQLSQSARVAKVVDTPCERSRRSTSRQLGCAGHLVEFGVLDRRARRASATAITPTTAPISGKTMNAHSCCSASVSVSANRAVARLRTGLTEVLSTGIEIEVDQRQRDAGDEAAHARRGTCAVVVNSTTSTSSAVNTHLDDDRRTETEVRAGPQVRGELAALVAVLAAGDAVDDGRTDRSHRRPDRSRRTRRAWRRSCAPGTSRA